jgi:DNA-binding response OmpR family regulator
MARILIIEDDDHCRELLRLMLEPAGHAVVDACNGREGPARYCAAPTDVVILDLFMPEQEGLETIQALRREYPTVKIIAISRGDRTGTLDLLPIAAQLGAQRTLWKPFGLRELCDAVEAVIGIRAVERPENIHRPAR